MKYFLFLLLIIPTFVLSQFDAKYESRKHIKVDRDIKKYFEMVVHFYRTHDVDIDYRNIRAIKFEDDMRDQNGYGLAGYYGEDKVIRIRKKANNLAIVYGIYDELIIVTLAHEIGHSQGLLHVEDDITHLMYPTNGALYNALISKNMKISDILLSPYVD